MEAMQKALDDISDDEDKRKPTKRKPENAVYVLNFRYKGGCSDTNKLEKKLNGLGWYKTADLTSCYTKNVTDKTDEDSSLHHDDVERHLREHVPSNKSGAEVRYGISKYIPPNQRPDNYEGIDTLFDEKSKHC